MKLLIPAKILKAALIYASKDDARYNVSCLSFEAGKVIATDGQALLVWEHGATLHTEGDKDPDFLLPLDTTARKLIKSANKRVDAFQYDTDTCVLADVYGGQSCILTQKENAEFPSWREVMPDIGTLTPIPLTINSSIITQFAKYAKARKGEGIHGFTLLTRAIDRAFYLMPDGFSDCFIVAIPMHPDRTLDNHLETIRKISDMKKRRRV